ncbi:hypothetical protein B0H17DRAFT_1141721 [Mycena rosella]|uniref:Uncharacterized protein n=1 Tax=Mycena rosella TaxID=1033263 RepID=A0AAD7G6C8_MYCRO|nr:hypothetical protein B0H17DRAFT_1141721 [Mycena rosella]
MDLKNSIKSEFKGQPLNYISPTFSWTVVYRGTVPKRKLAEAFPEHVGLEGPKLHVISHPIGPNIGLNCFHSCPEMEGGPREGPMVTDAATQDVCRLFNNWEPDFLAMIRVGTAPPTEIYDLITLQNAESYTAWAIHVVNPHPCYASGFMVLVGHAPSISCVYVECIQFFFSTFSLNERVDSEI